jgi:hypothetical protein
MLLMTYLSMVEGVDAPDDLLLDALADDFAEIITNLLLPSLT